MKTFVYSTKTKNFAVEPNLGVYALFKVTLNNGSATSAGIDVLGYDTAYRSSELDKPKSTDEVKYYWKRVCDTTPGIKTSKIG